MKIRVIHVYTFKRIVYLNLFFFFLFLSIVNALQGSGPLGSQ
jgi:hypothetical protein